MKGGTSRPSSTPTPRSPSPSSTIARPRSPRPISSTTAWCPSTISTRVRLCRVLTDRGTEYCGNPEHHQYELYLAVEDVDHSRTQDQEPANEWNRRALPQTVLRVLPSGVPQAHLRFDRRAAGGSRRVDQELQRKQTPSGPLVLRQNPHADLP